MADAAVQIVPTVVRKSRNTITVTWSGMTGAATGQAVDLAGYPDKTIHVYGTYGSATTTLYGATDSRVNVDRIAGTLFGSATAAWGVLHDALGNNLAITSGSVPKTVLENTESFSPVNSGGTGTSLTVVIEAVRGRI